MNDTLPEGELQGCFLLNFECLSEMVVGEIIVIYVCIVHMYYYIDRERDIHNIYIYIYAQLDARKISPHNLVIVHLNLDIKSLCGDIRIP